MSNVKLTARMPCLLALALTAFLPSAALAQQTISDCFIEPNRVAEISSSVDGVVEKIYVQRGDTIKRGQAIVSLESHVEKATVELARVRAERTQAIEARTARVEFTRRLLERNQELYNQKLISEQVVDETETDALLAELELGEILEEKKIAELELERARQALAVRTIRSPFGGIVIDVLVAPGESIENRSLVKLASIDPLNVEVIAPVGLFGKISKGMKATVIPEAPIGGEYTARVVIVDRVLDAASGTFGIRLQLSNENYKLPAGLRCTVKLESPDVSAPESKTENDDALSAVEKTVSTAGAEQAAEIRKPAGDETPGYVYTLYLFSTRSEKVASQVNERFRDQGHPTEVLVSENDGLVHYRVAVTGFESLQSANEYSDAIVGTLGVSKTWVGKYSR